MNSFMLDDKGNAETTTLPDGLKTLSIGCGTPVYSQLVKLKLLSIRRGKEYEPDSLIDWPLYLSNPVLGSVLGNQVRNLISSSEGVESVDLTKATYSLNPSPRISGICFTVGCERCELSL